MLIVPIIFEALSNWIKLLECQIGWSLPAIILAAASPIKAFAQMGSGLARLDVAVVVAARVARLVLPIRTDLPWLTVARDFAMVFNVNPV